MTLYVVHGDKRNAEAHGSCLCKVESDKHSPDKSGRIARRDGIDIAFFYSCSLHGALRKTGYDLDVASLRYLRHNTAINGVQVGLREYLICQYVPSVFYDSDGCFVAG